jgi:hypothetical protein
MPLIRKRKREAQGERLGPSVLDRDQIITSARYDSIAISATMNVIGKAYLFHSVVCELPKNRSFLPLGLPPALSWGDLQGELHHHVIDASSLLCWQWLREFDCLTHAMTLDEIGSSGSSLHV